MIKLSEIEQYLSKAAWILKGPVDASDFKVYIFPLLYFKRISDVYDEEYFQLGYGKIVIKNTYLILSLTITILRLHPFRY
jgi:type I restriction-modification system DNA methylase subunit